MDEITRRHERMQADGDWRGHTLAGIRAAILAADSDVVEEIKWRKPTNPDGVVAYSHGGLIGTLEVYKEKVKFTFAKGQHLPEPSGVSWTGGGVRRAMDLFEGDEVPDGFGELFLAAVALQNS